MITYLSKAEIEGVEIRMIYIKANDEYHVIYGVQMTKHNDFSSARAEMESCVRHAYACCGYYED
jgi:hypothetical protein